MKKAQFLKELRKALAERGLTPDAVESEIGSVSAYFSEEGMEEIEIPVSEMADEISALITEQDELSANNTDKALTPDSGSGFGFSPFEIDGGDLPADGSLPSGSENDRDKGSTGTAVPAAVAAAVAAEEESLKSVADQIGDTLKSFDEKENTAITEDKSQDEDVGNSPERVSPVAFFRDREKKSPEKTLPETQDAESPEEKKDDLEFDDDVKEYRRGSIFGKNREEKPAREEDDNQPPTPAGDDADDENINDYTYAEFDDAPVKSPAFTVLLIFAIPIIAALALVATAIYLVFWAALALLLICVVALLIAFVAAGVTVALIGIVYGVIMMIKGNVPVGLFEIGLGVTVGAVVLFIGILVYNFAIRLIPFAMKMLAKLLGFAFTKTKEGLRYIKKLLARSERQ